MKNILPFLLLLLTSCNIIDSSHLQPEFVVDPIVDVTNPYTPSSPFDDYSLINQQTSKITSQKFFTGDYLKKTFLDNIELGGWNSSIYFRPWGPSTVQFDYNKDGNVDLFGFMTDFSGHSMGVEWGINHGKFFLIDDFKSDSLDIKYYDAPFARGNSEFEVGNFDMDDDLEILVMSEDGHVRNDGTEDLTNSLINIIDVDVDGNISITRFGHGSFAHQIASGDVDNDGDLDIMYYLSDGNVVHQTKGRYGMFQLLLNNGDATFTEQHPFDTFKNLQDSLSQGNDEYYYNWRMTTVELFDMNGDDILDMITSITHDSCDDGDNIGTPLCTNKTQIYWGQGNGKFDMSKVTNLPNEYKKLIENDVYTYQEEFFPLSHSIFDFDNDGHTDLISVIVKDTQETSSYDGFYLQIHKNMGNNIFEDVSHTIIEEYTHANLTGDSFCYDFDFRDLYEFVPYDKDGDGDYDIVPNKVTTWDVTCNVNKKTYFENVNGKFYLRNQ